MKCCIETNKGNVQVVTVYSLINGVECEGVGLRVC